MAKATFYVVNGPRAVYYAARNQETGKVWTERTELAARTQGAEEGLEWVEELTISHAQLLDLMIPQAMPQPADSPLAGSDEPTRPVMRVEKGLSRFFRRLRGDSAGTASASR